MSGKETAAMIQNPECVWLSPTDILKDSRLSAAEKLSALTNWEADQKALLRADDENMAQQEPDRVQRPEDTLRAIQTAERMLDGERVK